MILELGHRKRRLTLGYLALVVIELPIIDTFIDNTDAFGFAIYVAVLLAVLIYALIAALHLTPLIHQLETRPETSP